MYATYHAHLIFLDLVTLLMFSQKYKLWSYSICTFLRPPVISPLLGQYILLNTLIKHHLIYVLPLVWESKFRTHVKKQTII
jgi:hypothetical protein